MMFFSARTNAKFNLIAGMAIGVGMAVFCNEICKKRADQPIEISQHNKTGD